MKLDIKDRMGLCHNLGTYCSSRSSASAQRSGPPIAALKASSAACFRNRAGHSSASLGERQKEQCQGFTVDEFARLDLSVMDFTEVYADFMDAAKLPDEVQTMTDIQAKIQSYYDLHGK
jgi:conjugal transfer mating pair stabilization protein TraN